MDRDAIIAVIERLLDDVAATNAQFADDARRLFEVKLARGATTEELVTWSKTLRRAMDVVKKYTKGGS